MQKERSSLAEHFLTTWLSKITHLLRSLVIYTMKTVTASAMSPHREVLGLNSDDTHERTLGLKSLTHAGHNLN